MPSKVSKSKTKSRKKLESNQPQLESTMHFISSVKQIDENEPKNVFKTNKLVDASFLDKSIEIENSSDSRLSKSKQIDDESSLSKTREKSNNTNSASNNNNKNRRPKTLVNKRLGNVKTLSSIINTSITNTSQLNSPRHCNSNRKITDYFQIRKSSRKCKSDIEKEKRALIEEAIKTGREDGLEVQVLESKGRAVFASKPFRRGDFVCEYYGEMIGYQAAIEREQAYMKDPNIGCYMYFFEYKSTRYCIDATAESDRLGRLLNHSKLDGNCQTKIFEINTKPHLIIVAARDILAGEELTYDYGDRNKNSLESHPWLAT